MENFIAYFSTIPSSHRAALLAGGIALFWLLESAAPFIRFTYSKWQHAGINLFFTGTTILVNFALAFLLLRTADFSIQNEIGLLNLLPAMPTWLFLILGLLGLDFFGAYLAHYVEHRWYPLWRFHLIHHTDTYLDTTSGNRHHPGESVIRFAFTCLGVLIVGCPMWLVFLYQSLSVVMTQFNHANIGLPKKLDRWMSYVLVSPDMHKVHHHYQHPYTDSNYGNIFSVWDRVLGTYRYLDRAQIVYGIDTHQDPKEHNTLSNLLQIPFQSLRKPTNKPD